jgi:hypothetical protein
MGAFSSDRTVREYAHDIWKIQSLEPAAQPDQLDLSATAPVRAGGL